MNRLEEALEHIDGILRLCHPCGLENAEAEAIEFIVDVAKAARDMVQVQKNEALLRTESSRWVSCPECDHELNMDALAAEPPMAVSIYQDKLKHLLDQQFVEPRRADGTED